MQLYSERGLGSGAGQVEAETASLAKVTFTSEQFPVYEEICGYFDCLRIHLNLIPPTQAFGYK